MYCGQGKMGQGEDSQGALSRQALIAYFMDGGVAASDGSFGRSENEWESGICSNTIVRG